QIGVMGAQGAVNILYRRELSNVADNGGDVETRRKELIDDYEAALLNPYEAADSGYIDAVIAPSETRAQVVRALRATTAKRESRPARKHVNIPLSSIRQNRWVSPSRALPSPRKRLPLC